MADCVYSSSGEKSSVWNRQRPGLNRDQINSLSYCKWDVLYHRYDRGIMGNEFGVILMIPLSFIVWSEWRSWTAWNSVLLARSVSFTLSLLCRTIDLGMAGKELTAGATFFPFVHFLSAMQECFILWCQPNTKSSKEMLVGYVGLNSKECYYLHIVTLCGSGRENSMTTNSINGSV